MTKRMSHLVKNDDMRERIALLRVVERVAYIVLGIYLGYVLATLAP